MGKAAKWLRSLLTGKKEKEQQKWGQSPAMTPIIMRSGPLPMMPPPREKKRWSFRRSVTGTAMEQKAAAVNNNNNVRGHFRGNSDSELDRRRADAAVIRLTNTATVAVEGAAAVKIQSLFRSHLARKALCALKGLVKLQALIRGHLVRRQATATLRSMQAMVTAQARARLQRIRMLEEAQAMSHHGQNYYRRSPQTRQSFVTNHQEMDQENVKIVEMDIGESRAGSNSKGRSNYLSAQPERRDHRLANYTGSSAPYKREASPARSILSSTDKSPRASGHFGEYYFASESSPPYLSTPSLRDSMKSPTTAPDQDDHNPSFPSYMANTESSRAKSRSHSAPRQRPDPYERQPGRRSISRPPSYLSSAIPEGYRYPWSIKLDRSSVSLQESECESMSSILTNAKYARSLMAYHEVHSELALNINSYD